MELVEEAVWVKMLFKVAAPLIVKELSKSELPETVRSPPKYTLPEE